MPGWQGIQQSYFAPHMVSTNKLKVNQFLHGLKVEIHKIIKMFDYKGVPYIEVVEKAIKAKEAKLRVMKGSINS